MNAGPDGRLSRPSGPAGMTTERRRSSLAAVVHAAGSGVTYPTRSGEHGRQAARSRSARRALEALRNRVAAWEEER